METPQENTDRTDEKQIEKPWLFQKGQSGNPHGRPKGRFSITSLIIQQLDANPDQTEEIITWLLSNRKDLVWKMIDPEPAKDLNTKVHVTFQPFDEI